VENKKMNTASISGLVLAGGRGTRMGSVDKGLQPSAARPWWRTCWNACARKWRASAINANQNLDAYGAFGVPVWPDDTPGFAGPLAGLEAGCAAAPRLICWRSPATRPSCLPTWLRVFQPACRKRAPTSRWR
jgi:molybdopterin molybdotransferase